MKEIEELSSQSNKPKLIPHFKKTERRLLSVFMAALEIVPEFRAVFLERCEYGSGRSCNYQSFMEPHYPAAQYSDARPDGLIICTRGSAKWSAFIEAKAEKFTIKPEQILGYTELAGKLGVDAVICISNEFASSPAELPYHLDVRKRKGKDVLHFSWAEVRTFMELFWDSDKKCNETERVVIRHCLDYFWYEESGISTYDLMPNEWPNFVESAATSLGFTTKTPGITEIVHGWQQERRDLGAKLIYGTKRHVEMRHSAGIRASAEDRVKHDKRELADNYQLDANYYFKETQATIRVLASLKSCHLSAAIDVQPPSGKKARASVSWAVEICEMMDLNDGKISFNWKGRNADVTMTILDFLQDSDRAHDGNKDAPKNIRIITESHNVRRFKSRKLFIEDLEAVVLALAERSEKAGLI